MCEPNHSIVQFPDKNDDDKPSGPAVDALASREGYWDRIKRKIKQWFHLSRMGRGHSETLEGLSPLARRYLPRETRYEVAWWNRKTTLDGVFWHPDSTNSWCQSAFEKSLQKEALDAADQYARMTSIGNMTQLRQFLEASLTRSERPQAYVNHFYDMLVAKGRDLLRNKLKMIGDNLMGIIKTIMGFTRKRNLLVPEWADDTTVWVPSPA